LHGGIDGIEDIYALCQIEFPGEMRSRRQDAASGVEAGPRRKDVAKVQEFVRRSRAAGRKLNDAGIAENLIFSRPRAGRHLRNYSCDAPLTV
jgi:hypothetical protein